MSAGADSRLGCGTPDYRPLTPRRCVEVRQLCSVHYFEYPSGYTYPGERHDFWELLYVDKGTLSVTAGDRALGLAQGQIIFHAPGEFHALSAQGAAPDLVVVSFRCDSPAMDFFRQRVCAVRREEQALLGKIVAESAAAFSTPLNAPSVLELVRRDQPPFGGEQLVCAALEELLIRLIRREGVPQPPDSPRTEDGGMFAQVTAYLERQIDRPLTLDQICRDNLVGRSQLQKLFHTSTGSGVMAYFNALKIRTAKRMIREGRLNFTQIAARLGYQSVHYFSRRFHLATGMSPSEYEKSVKMLSESIVPDDSANNVYNRIFPSPPEPLTIETQPND